MLTHFSISQQGQRHVEKNVPCQDNSFSCRLHIDRFDKDVVIAAVADGVGSCEFSADGSKAAIEGFFECVMHNLNEGKNVTEFNDENVDKIIRHAFGYALAKVYNLSEEKQLPFLEFDSTLTGVVYDGENLWFGHVGDDGVVALYTDGTYEMITARHKGDEASSVFPLRDEPHWQFGKAPKAVASAVLMTDGVLDYCVGTERLNNRVYYPFLEPALTEVMADDEAAEVSCKDWDEYLGGEGDYPVNFRTLVTDDISFAVIQNSEAVKNLPQIEFDSIKWDEDTARYKEELRKALYGDPKKPAEPEEGDGAEPAEAGEAAETDPAAPAPDPATADNTDPAPEADNGNAAPATAPAADPADKKDDDSAQAFKENVKAFASSAFNSLRECCKQIKEAAVKAVKDANAGKEANSGKDANAGKDGAQADPQKPESGGAANTASAPADKDQSEK